MFRPLKGAVLFAFGVFAVADSFLGIVQKSTGSVRWLYFVLGVYLVVRGLFILKPFIQERIAREKNLQKPQEET
ncbi:MAG: hypothetical protein ACREOO_29880 [bacterium]